MRIAILGAGFAGLSAAYQLTKRGYGVTIFEKESYPGGLASGFKQPNWEWPLEKAYHHLFTSDWDARNLLTEIGMGDKLVFKRPISASLYGTESGKWKVESREAKKNSKTHSPLSTLHSPQIYQFDSPLSLLQFPRLPLKDKLLTGIILAYLKFTPYWKDFEKTTIKEWLIHNMGKRSYEVLWEPILVGKFGPYAEVVNMAWFWARIRKRSMSLGYIEGGFQSFAERLAQKVKDQGGTIHLGTEVTDVRVESGEWRVESGGIKKNLKTQNPLSTLHSPYDIIFSTLPTPIYLKLFPQFPKSYIKQLTSIPHLHALNLVLELKEPFFPPIQSSNSQTHSPLSTLHSPKPYWVNICSPFWPFLAVVEHTNFIDPKHYGGHHLLYIGNYLPREHGFFKKSKEELLELFKPYLSSISPSTFHSPLSILNSYLFVGPFAQPVVTVNYSKIRPDFVTPLPNLYMGNLDSVYPWDRGTNYAIELGKNAAELIVKRLKTEDI